MFDARKTFQYGNTVLTTMHINWRIIKCFTHFNFSLAEAHISTVLIKKPLSAEEEKCLEQTVTTPSLARLSQYIRHWKLVASELSLSTNDVECLEYENENMRDLSELKY